MPGTEQQIVETLEKNYMPYVMSVIMSRAIPEIDGFKPSHRKLLYTMYKMGLLSGQRTKSANVVGQTMKLNPHGDAAIYETMVRLTRGNGALLHPYIDSKGNFGKQFSRDMQYAASRYTEVRLEKIARELFLGIDEDTVDFVDNYDGQMKEPLLLPVTFPSVLVNMNQGIAVGMASNVASFNLREACLAAAACIDDESADIMGIMPAPDLPSGGQLIYSEKALRDVYETGRGSFRVRAKYSYDKKNSCVEITEIPYTTSVEAIIDSIVDLVKKGRVKDIVDVRDETGLSGLKIAVDIRKNADADELMHKLFRLTPLEDSFGCNFNILVGGKPRVMGVREILREWLAFRAGCLRRLLTFDAARKRERLHLLEGLQKVLLDIDKAIRIIRGTENDKEVAANLMAGFGIDQAQADYICEIKLRNLNKAHLLEKAGEADALRKDIAGIEQTLASEKRLRGLIKRQLEKVAKEYGKERMTEIVHEDDIVALPDDSFIEDYNARLFLTSQGYIKKIPLTSLRSSGEHKLKEGDFFVQELDIRNKQELLLFTDKGAVCKVKASELSESKASAMGEYLANVLRLAEGEKAIYVAATDNYEGCMLFGFENGKFTKVALSGYATKTNRKRLQNAYSTASPLVCIRWLAEGEDIDIVAISNLGKALVFSTAMVPVKTARGAQGVQALKEKRGSHMREALPLEASGIKDPGYYRTRNIPAIGRYLRGEDASRPGQMTL